MSLVEAAAALRSRSLSPTELMRSLLVQIESHDAQIHAFVSVSDRAIDDAAAVQREWEADGPRTPLHGIPFAAKDLFDTAGLATTANSRHWESRVPSQDSRAVSSLRSAGMPLIGKTTTHEFAHGATTPAARNPWDLTRLPGGSSGGSAAALSARMVPAALGTDTGGSIRTPASICGVVGLKPTFGRVPRTGVASLSWSLDHVGPMARSVADVALLLEALSGYDAADPASVDRPIEETRPTSGKVDGLVIGIPTSYYTGDFDAAVLSRVEEAGKHLQAAGAKLEPVELPYAHLYEATEFTILSAEASAYHAQRIRRAPELFSQDVRGRLEAGMGILATDYINALRTRSLIQQAWRELMQQVDMILAPTVPGTAVPAHDPVYYWQDKTEDAGYAYVRSTLPANLTGLPALSIPIGTDESNLPIGGQLIGRPFQESVVLQAGLCLEESYPPLGQPPLLDRPGDGATRPSPAHL